ncbi:MAG: aldehyde dehydrogenase [Deltaproteobacteria bacterium]|nr:aldehyde dehydrogenase [Deltaproteobacteria bacterium]
MRIGINGFGRIGRAVARVLLERGGHEIVHINDINPDTNNLAYLLNYDSIYGRLAPEVRAESSTLLVGGKAISVSHESKISTVAWADKGVDVVVEATGVKENERLAKEMVRSTKFPVFVTNACPDADTTLLFGVSDKDYDPARHKLVAMSICDTNACAPILKLLDEAYGIDHGYITTLHPWLSYQNLMDGPSRSQSYPGATHSHFALGRSSIGTLIPKPTTVVSACERALPHIQGKLQCMSYRVPTSIVSTADMVITVKKPVSDKDVLKLVEGAQAQMPNVLRVTGEPLISLDYMKDSHSVIFDSRWLMVNAGHHIKMVLWYDNEWGYSSRVADGIDLYGRLRA